MRTRVLRQQFKMSRVNPSEFSSVQPTKLTDTAITDFNNVNSGPRRNVGDTSMTLDLEAGGGDRLYAMVPKLSSSMALDASGNFVTREERVSRGRSRDSHSGRR